MVGNDGQSAAAQGSDQDKSEVRPKFSKYGYFLLNFIVIGISTGLSIALWSSMGYGENLLGFFKDHSTMMHKAAGFGLAASIIGVLYLLDFFWPPHLGGSVLVLWHGDRFVGKSFFFLAMIILYFASCLMVKTYPSVPLVISLVLAPVGAVGVRLSTGNHEEEGETSRVSWIVNHGDVKTKEKLLSRIVGQENDLLYFFQGVTAAFIVSGLISLIAWAAFVAKTGGPKKATSKIDGETMAIIWVTPVVAAISDLVFGLMCVLRLVMNSSYTATNEYKNRLIAEGITFELHNDMMAHKTQTNGIEVGEATDHKKHQYVDQHAQYIAQLSKIVKVVICIFVLLGGFLYVAMLLLYVDKKISSMILGLLAVFFISFVCFVYVTFKRIVEAMEKWVSDLPMWKMAMGMVHEPWLLAMATCTLISLSPFVIALSWINQQVRKMRGIYTRFPEVAPCSTAEGAEPNLASQPRYSHQNPEALQLTPRIMNILEHVQKWDMNKVIAWIYIWCSVYFAYSITPRFLNVALSGLQKVFMGRQYVEIVGAVFGTGVVAFLLPPVPGMTVYVFGGLLLANEKTCPYGFWGGSFINIGVCFVLKLTACAIQQKFIGEMCGGNQMVRSMIGVHKPSIRCIEAELRKPGLSLGKVAILCGGPDWPVSVLAGILKLSVVQCELGTCPIILFIAPCALTGSFYLKKSQGQIWSTLSSLTVASTMVITAILWMIVAWALQHQLETNKDELSRPLKQNVDAEWVDYRDTQIAKRCDIPWDKIPSIVRYLYVLGAFIHIVICQALFMGSSYIFGSFEVQDPFDSLIWYRSGRFLVKKGVKGEPIISIAAILILAFYVLGWFGSVQINKYRAAATRQTRKMALSDMNAEEASWKQDYLQRCEASLAKAEASANQPEEAAEEAKEANPPQARVASEERVHGEVDVSLLEEPPSPPSESVNKMSPRLVTRLVSTPFPGEDTIGSVALPCMCCMQDRPVHSPRDL